MKCPECSGYLRAYETTYTEENETYRKRKCLACGHVLYTMEFEIENTPEFQKEWGRLLSTSKPAYERRKKKIYTLSLTKNGEVVAHGMAEECAKQMDISVVSFRKIISRINKRKTKKYEVQISYNTDERMEKK